jgi:NAD-dependent SIR2 family protein deacetylase
MSMSAVDFPPLVDAHASGELVIFVGAGASIPPPSALPTFKQLVETIRDESNLGSVIGSLDDQPLDEVLGKIADDYGVDVHEQVHELTDRQGARPNPVHKAIVKLASASTIRMVTTNYDQHLDVAQRAR